MVVSKLSRLKSPKKPCSISKTISYVFYTLERECQLHRHLPVAQAVEYLTRGDYRRVQK
jgi:hypothetical protein